MPKKSDGDNVIRYPTRDENAMHYATEFGSSIGELRYVEIALRLMIANAGGMSAGDAFSPITFIVSDACHLMSAVSTFLDEHDTGYRRTISGKHCDECFTGIGHAHDYECSRYGDGKA